MSRRYVKVIVTKPRRFTVTPNLDTCDGSFSHGKVEKHLQTMKKKTKKMSPLSYIDLLLMSLTQHEKNLSQMVERLDRITQNLEKISNHLSDNTKRN